MASKITHYIQTATIRFCSNTPLNQLMGKPPPNGLTINLDQSGMARKKSGAGPGKRLLNMLGWYCANLCLSRVSAIHQCNNVSINQQPMGSHCAFSPFKRSMQFVLCCILHSAKKVQAEFSPIIFVQKILKIIELQYI